MRVTTSPIVGTWIVIGCLCACRTAYEATSPTASVGWKPAPPVVAPAPVAAKDPPPVANATFGYLLSRYDADGDLQITLAEYPRRDGQFARWDLDRDGRLTEADWGGNDLQVTTQIMELRKQRVLGRYFQMDDETDVLTIDELAEAFIQHYDGATGSAPDEELDEGEFHAVYAERSVVLPGDESMQLQNYSRSTDPWSELVGTYDYDGDKSVDLTELCAVFEELDVYELHFDREHADAGEVDGLDYLVGLPVGSPVPDLTLTPLHEGETVSLRDFVHQKPIALIFGSYT